MDFNSRRKRHSMSGESKPIMRQVHADEFLPSEIRDDLSKFTSVRRSNGRRTGRQARGEIRAQEPTRQQRHRHMHTANKTRFVAVIAATFVIVVILFAIFWENPQSANPETAGQDAGLQEDLLSNYPPEGRSPQQDLLNELYWVDQDFLDINRFSRPGILIEEINGIVIHFIGNPNTTAQQNRNFFNNLAVTEERHASSNFIVCLDGRVVQCVPVDEVAYASHHRNYDTLSIELCHPDETGAFTDETLEAAIRLTAWLSVQFGLTADDIIRHYDIVRSDGSQKRCPRYFVDNEEAWASFKNAVTEAMTEFS